MFRHPHFIAASLIILVGLLSRTHYLRSIPVGVTRDEMFFAIEAQTVAIDGQDFTGTNRPWLTLTPSHAAFSELPATLMAPGYLVSADPLIASRVVPVLIGLLIPVFISLITLHLTKSRHTALIALFIATFNPWIFQFSRTSIDAPPALLLCLIATWLHLSQRGWRKTWSIPVYFLGFFTYQGYKLIWLPLTLITTIYLLTELEFWKKPSNRLPRILPLVLPLLVMLVIFFSYIFRLQNQSASVRVNNLLPMNQQLLSSLVNTERRLSLVSPIQPLVTNKITLLGWTFLDQYSESFNPKLLFLRGEPALNPFAVWSHGIYFYPIDAVLIALGLITLLSRKNKRIGWYLLAILLISPLPTALNSSNVSITFRSSLLVFPLIITAAAGLSEILKRGWVLKLAVIALYALLIMHFFYQYFFRFPIYSADGRYLADRVVSSYVRRSGQSVKVFSSNELFAMLESYLFFGNQINQKTLPLIRQALSEERYQFGEVEFVQDCLDIDAIVAGETIVAAENASSCPGQPAATPSAALSVARVLDSGEIYRIYNDQLCQPYELRPFLHLQRLSQFDVENLSDEEFCQTWITDLSSLRD